MYRLSIAYRETVNVVDSRQSIIVTISVLSYRYTAQQWEHFIPTGNFRKATSIAWKWRLVLDVVNELKQYEITEQNKE